MTQVWLNKLLALRSDKTVKTAVAGYRAAWAAGIEIQKMPAVTNPDNFARRMANAWIRNRMGNDGLPTDNEDTQGD